MNWGKLKEHRCPRCNHKLEYNIPFLDEIRCSDPHCMFKISEEKFIRIIRNLQKKMDEEKLQDNLEDLNNLVI